MSEFLDYDPVTGISHYFDYNEATGDAIITSQGDVEPLLNHTRSLANDKATDGGIKKGWWLYAKIPPIVMLKMRAKGIDIHDSNATKRIIQEINEHYPALKVTQKNDSGIAPAVFVPKVTRC